MIGRVAIFVCFFIISSCLLDRSEMFDRTVANDLSAGWGDQVPSNIIEDQLFVKSDSGRFCRIYWNTLYVIYQTDFQREYLSFGEFSYLVLNQKLYFPSHYLKDYNCNSFSLNSEICNMYDSQGLEYLIDKFTVYNQSNKLVVKTDKLSHHQIDTFLYYLFTEGYSFTMDDYLGSIYVKKRMH
jgi:hypothetical protein